MTTATSTHKPNKITIHCTGSINGRHKPIEEIKKDHLARGFIDIGYHLIVQPDGQLDRGRGLNEVGAHVEGANVGNIGMCLVGTDRFTRAQFDILRSQIDSIRMIYGIPEWEIYVHSCFPTAIKQGKVCPNIPWNVILGWIIGHHEKALDPYILK